MTNVLIVDPDRPTGRWLKSILEHDQFTADVVYSGEDALARIAEHVPQVIVLETALPDMNGIELIRSLRKESATREIGIVVLSAQMQIEDIQAGLDAGANEYLAKRPGVDAEIIAKIRVLAAHPPNRQPPAAPLTRSSRGNGASQNRRGKIFSFCSAKGGTGVTSICINTAYALTRAEPRAEILVADMVFPLGTVGASLGYESSQTVARLTQTIKDKMDVGAVKSFVSRDREHGFHILLSANDMKEANALEVSQIVPMFETLREMYDYIFVDFGRSLSRISLPIIEMSDLIVIVVTPDMNTVKMTKIILHHLDSLGVSHRRIAAIMNRPVGRMWITKEEMENELGLALVIAFPYEMEHFTMAINAGVPYMEKFSERSTSVVFTNFAQTLVERAR